ncbi:MAG: ABC transporter permease [Proteobacteria bacterium]|nr:ABC transporter permease [Pseudomonadota bacterium]
MTIRSLSLRRLVALCRKEVFQIVRDPSSIIIAFILPIVLLVIFGYGVNLDASRVRLGVLVEDNSAEATSFALLLTSSPYLETRLAGSREELDQWLDSGAIRGMAIIPSDFGTRVQKTGSQAPLEVITDGAEPNTANFVASYLSAAWRSWFFQRTQDRAATVGAAIVVVPRYWFNPAATSRNFIIPGSIAIIMTIIGAMLTSLVIAREWECGTMEALLSTPVTKTEFLLSKVLPYYVLGIASMLLCLTISIWLFQVPFRGSLLLLILYTSLFLGSSLGLGLLLSTITRNQFDAAQSALNAAFLPATILSGFVYEVSSMPLPIQAVTYLIPARYFVSALQTLFQAGFVAHVLLEDLIFLLLSATLFLGLTALKTARRLD